MGAENSVLEGCQWGDEVTADDLDWELQHADAKDGRPITVFQPRKSERKYRDMIQQLAKSLKTLRHPGILRYIGAGKTSEGCFLVTEQATPLGAVLDKLSTVEVCAGLGDILEAVVFLHDKVGVSHNNIGVGAVFVAKDGGWRLGELQHACPHGDATSQFLDACRAYRDQAALSPEEKQGNVEVKSGQGHARDMFAIGVLIEHLSDQLTELGEFSKTFEQKVAACLSTEPAQRPSALELKNDSLFQNDFIQMLSFIRNVALKTVEEKTEFFNGLLPRLLSLPDELVARRLAVPLLSRFVLLDNTAVTRVVPHILTPKPDEDAAAAASLPLDVTPVLTSDLFKDYVIPEVQRIFLVHDAHIRLVLLRYFPRYLHLFEPTVLQAEIFPQILLGLRDSSDEIVASSLRSLADLVPLLGGSTVIGGQRKTFFFHGMPKLSPRGDKEDGGASVTDVMKSLRTAGVPLTPNGRPLLKDLAALAPRSGGVTGARDSEEQQRRQAERERRREEARLRKEERQRKFKLLQAEVDTVTETEETADTTTTTTTTTIFPDVEDITNNSDEDYRSVKNKTHDQPQHSGDPAVNIDNNSDKTTNYDAEEKYASEESGAEWEDWDNEEDKGSDSPRKKSLDDIISDEIEAELSQMPQKGEGSGKKVATSPDPYRHGSPVELDSGSSQFDSLVSSPVYVHSHGEEGTVSDSGPVRSSPADSTRFDSRAGGGKSLKLVAKSKSATSSSSSSTSSSSAAKIAQAKKSAARKNNDLGAGYDIKSIELASTETKEEVDFFADMTPQIKKSSLDKMMGLVAPGGDGTGETEAETEKTSGGTKDSEAAAAASSLLFAVAASTGVEEEAGGWEGEDDWGTDDF